MKSIEDVIDGYSGNSRKVLEYGLLMKRMVDEAKQPDFSAASWDVLRDLVAADDFVRVGNFKETQDFAGYVEFLTAWAPAAEWECSFKRITEIDGRVFLELEERSRVGEFSSVVNSMSVYDFDADGKIHHLDVYLQMPPL